MPSNMPLKIPAEDWFRLLFLHIISSDMAIFNNIFAQYSDCIMWPDEPPLEVLEVPLQG